MANEEQLASDPHCCPNSKERGMFREGRMIF